MVNKDKYISLKEAAELSGYSSDYVGQLIRGGKIDGKKVFSNVSWMVDKEELEKYIESKKEGNGKSGKASKYLARKKFRNYIKLYKLFLYMAIVFLLAFAVFLFFVLSVNIEDRLEKKTIKPLEVGSTSN